MSDKGNCPKHGEFVLTEGCEKCLAEQKAKRKAESEPGFVPVPEEQVTDGLSEEEQVYEAAKADESASLATTTVIVAVAPDQDAEVLKLRELILAGRDSALAMTVKTPEEARDATNALSVISNLKVSLIKRRKELLGPHQDYIKEVNDAFKLIGEPLLEADKAIRDKILAFKLEQERLQQEAEKAAQLQREADEAARKVREETGEIVEGQAEAPVVVPTVTSQVHADLGTAGMRSNWKYEVTDFSLLPDEYKVLDSAMLNAIAKKHHDQKQIPGVRFYDEPSIIVTTKKDD